MAKSIEVALRRSESELTPFAQFHVRVILPPEALVWGNQVFRLERMPLVGPAEYVQVSAHVIDVPPLQTAASRKL